MGAAAAGAGAGGGAGAAAGAGAGGGGGCGGGPRRPDTTGPIKGPMRPVSSPAIDDGEGSFGVRQKSTRHRRSVESAINLMNICIRLQVDEGGIWVETKKAKTACAKQWRRTHKSQLSAVVAKF